MIFKKIFSVLLLSLLVVSFAQAQNKPGSQSSEPKKLDLEKFRNERMQRMQNFKKGRGGTGSLNEALANPTGVKNLILRGDSLTSLTPRIKELVELEKLDVSNNKLTDLPQELAALAK